MMVRKTYRKSLVLLGLLSLLFSACGQPRPEAATSQSEDDARPSVRAEDATGDAEVDGLEGQAASEEPAPPSGPKVTAYVDGERREVFVSQLEGLGMIVVDLSDEWVPFIFSEKDPRHPEPRPNRFRQTFVDLANDWSRTSPTKAAARAKLGYPALRHGRKPVGDSDECEGNEECENNSGPGEADNFLEVYGIPPTLSVLKRRAEHEVRRPCVEEIDWEKIRRYDGFSAYKTNGQAKKDGLSGLAAARRMRARMKKLGVTDPLALLEKEKSRARVKDIKEAIRYEALAETQKMLVCEGHFTKYAAERYTEGGIDWRTQQALLAFERKNRIFGWGYFGRETLEQLKKTPKERLYEAFVRVVQERVADAAGIIEDGSVNGPKGPPTYKDEDGQVHSVRNLVDEFTSSVLTHLGVEGPDDVIAFLADHTHAELDRLKAAFPMPKLPAYHGPNMELFVKIDRGDIWYDYPFTRDGKKLGQPRKRLPKLKLLTRWNGQTIPLAVMNTTIGGWRTERASDGYEYYKYKNSDVGERVWKDILAGPVWLPPATTPHRDMVTDVWVGNRKVTVPNYNEMGPWYGSAYGLVAAFHVRPVEKTDGEVRYFDNGIRSHGSVDYMSILRRFSHGCHRMYNHLAIRLFGFVLQHRVFERVGQLPASFSETLKVEKDDGEHEEIVLKLNTRGYLYRLEEPVPVEVLEGRVRGKVKRPIARYMPKPDEDYGLDAEFLPEEYRRAIEEQLAREELEEATEEDEPEPPTTYIDPWAAPVTPWAPDTQQ